VSNARLVAVIVIFVLSGWLLYLLAPVLTPFAAAFVLAYIGNPLVSRLDRMRVPRVLGVIVVFLLFAAIFLGLAFFVVPLLSDSIAGLVIRMPAYYDWAVTQWPRLEARFGIHLKLDLESLRQSLADHWQQVGDWTATVLGVATQSGLTVIRWLVNLVIIPVVTFYLLLDWHRLVARAGELVPARYRPQARKLARETDEVLGSFLRGQLLVMASLALIYTVGLWLIGLDVALPVGALAGAVSFVPYLGFITGLVAASVAAYLQFHDALMLLWVLCVFIAGQLFDATFLTPRLVGRRIGLHPVAVIFALMAGAQLFGFLGVLLALPTAAALKVWLRHGHESWIRASSRSRRR